MKHPQTNRCSRISLKAVIIIFLFPAFQGISHAANIDTSFRFSTIETAHFSVHFHQGLDELARKAAVMAEDAHAALAGEFQWTPQEKTQLVLIDDTDFTNGFATVLPYNTIYVQVVPPSIDMTIGEYDDWLKMIIVHEYAHILTMDPVRGYSGVTRRIFGKVLPYDLFSFLFLAPPNVFLPTWWLEGIATWAESEHGTGRGQSAFYDMVLRMAVADGNIPSVGQINGDVPYWPDGSMPYIFGLRMQKYIADRYGKDALGRLSIMHSGRAPYFINGVARGLFKRRYAVIYREMVDDLKMEEGKRVDALKQVPFTPIKRFEVKGEFLTNPRYSPNGRLIAFTRRDPHGHDAIWTVGNDGTKPREVVRRLPSDHAVCWSPDGSKIFFSQAEVNRGFNIYQDLYSYDLEKRKLKRLTRGLRIREPDISPDGRRFAVIVSERGSQNLALLEPGEGKYTLSPLTGHQMMRLSNPRWSPDGRHIAYAVKDNSGRSGIRLYDVTEGEDAVLFEDGHDNAYPAWSPGGRYLLYVSDETGVFNLFAYSMDEKRRYQVTHLLGGAFQPDVSPDGAGIVFSSYDSKGFKVAHMEYNPESWMREPGPYIEPYWKKTAEGRQEGAENGGLSGDPERSRSPQSGPPPRPYSALPTLLPRFWLPTFSSDHEGDVVGVFTAGQDVLGYNTYMAQAGLGVGSGRGYYDFIYLNDYFYPTFFMEAYATPVVYSDLVPGEDYFELNKGIIYGISVPINRMESRYRFTIGYHALEQKALDEPAPLNVFEGKRSNIFAGIEFSNSLKYPYSVSHEEGRTISLTHRYYSEDTGSDLDSREYLASYTEYLLMPFRHHVAYLNVKGAASEGDRTLQQSFQLGGYHLQSEFPLRGYPSRFATGQYLATATLEYRAPVKYIFRGPGTTPFFFDRAHMAAFVDAGEVWDDNKGFSSDELKVGAGMEARLDMTLGYRIGITPAIGIAQGLTEDGETVVYFTIYSNL